MNSSYQDLLTQFATQQGLDPDELMETQELLIDGLSVGFYEDGDLVFFANLGTPSHEHLARISSTLLDANYLWVGTGGCTLGVHSATRMVSLFGRRSMAELDAQTLGWMLDAFVDTALFWQAYVNGRQSNEPSSHIPAAVRA